MVKKMNKSDFIDELEKELKYSKSECTIINDVLESNFFISKKNKESIIKELVSRLDVDTEEATTIYDVSVNIIKKQVKMSLKHPFKNKD